MELFKVLPDVEGRLHPNFQQLLNPAFEEVRKEIMKWTVGFKDRDGKFIKEFQTTFNSSFWELYCNAVFHDLGFEIDYTKSTPDFVIKNTNGEVLFIAEATVSNSAEDAPKEYEKLKDMNLSIEESTNNSTLRLCNSIDTKVKKYRKTYCNYEYVKGKPFLIAIAPFDQPFFQVPSGEAIRRVLYGLDIELDGKNYYNYNMEEILKKNNASIELGYFRSEKVEEVTGVLFSCVATTGKARALSNDSNVIFNTIRYDKYDTKAIVGINYRKNVKSIEEEVFFNKEYDKIRDSINESFDSTRYKKQKPFIKEGYEETLTDGLHLYLNPYAKNKLSEDVIQSFIKKNIMIHTFNVDEDKDEEVNDVDGYLLQRLVRFLSF